MKKNQLVTSRYTKYTFFPVNLYEQLTKAPNTFFLVTLILLCIPAISPFMPFTYLIAFVCVVGASMAKDGYEDYQRHIYDDAFNKKITTTVQFPGTNLKERINKKYIEDLVEGDIVIVNEGEEIPGDVVFISAKNKYEGGIFKCTRICYVETSNLDGESNYKRKHAHVFREKRPCFLKQVEGYTICDCDSDALKRLDSFSVFDTGELLTEFVCKVQMMNEQVILHEKNILLRGSRLKNVSQIIGLVVSVGEDTKISKSNRKSKQRVSMFEREVFEKVGYIFLIYFVILTISSVCGALFLARDDIEYLGLSVFLPKYAFRQSGTEFIIYNYLIPISLFVTLELGRFMQGEFIKNDEKLKINGIKSICRNTNVTEDLGKIDLILSDKTGTITKNDMKLKHFHVKDEPTLTETSNYLVNNIDKIRKLDELVKKNNIESYEKALFALNLLCCNSVEIVSGKFEGASRDEVCILNDLLKNECVLNKRTEEGIGITLFDRNIFIKIPMILEFSSQRQRMSVIAEINGSCFLFSKGSDQKLIADEKYKNIKDIIDKNSEYRSLVVMYKELNMDVFNIAFNEYNESIVNRNFDKIDEIFERLESDMIYLGTTFIEDSLQDNVKNTISLLLEAGIKVWIVTGDKRETALCCAVNSGIFEKNYEGSDDFVSIEADLLIRSPGLFKKLIEAKSVIIYRASPEHKAKVADGVMKTGIRTLSIGDGNNDVPMIQSTHIGIGIRGHEGTQACLASDISVPEFQNLSRLLLVHGRNNLINLSNVVVNSFFKNVMFIFVQFYFDFFNGFTGKPVYNYYFLNYFNILFTSINPLLLIFFNKSHDDEQLMRSPKWYKDARKYLSSASFITHLIYSVFTASFIFWFSYGIISVKDFTAVNGIVGGYKAANNYFSFVVFFTVLIEQFRHVTYIVSYTYLGILFSVLMYFITVFLFQEFDVSQNLAALNLYRMPMFYICVIVMLSGVFSIMNIYNSIFERFFVKRRYCRP